MKTKNIIAASILFIATLSTGQTKITNTVTQCDELKKENEALKKSLNLNEPIIILTANDIEFKITKVKGDIKTQIVSIELLLTNKNKNRDISFTRNGIKIVTLEGEVLIVHDLILPERQQLEYYDLYTYLTTDVPIKCTFKFGTLLQTNKYIKLFNLPFKTNNNSPSQTSDNNEFKDLEIEWK